MKVLFAASEVAPISQLGGLGDVVSSLPLELYKLGMEIRIVVPFTTKIDFKRYKCTKILEYSFPMSGLEEHVNVWKTEYLPHIPVYILENKRYFNNSLMYRDFNGYLEQTRYAFFSKAVLELVCQWDFQPDIIHTHDYYTAIISLFRNTVYSHHPVISRIGILMTIHSLRAQGKVHHSMLDFIGIDKSKLNSFSKDIWGRVNLGVQGILNSDVINTVSPTYAKEVLTPQFGYGIEEKLKKRRKDFYGILNGIDVHEYNPRRKQAIYYSYGVSDVFRVKPKNKRKLLHRLNLSYRNNQPLLSIVTRLDSQKGIELIFDAFSQMMDLDFTFVLLGQGRPDYIKKFKQLAERYKDKVRANFSFDHELSKLIYAGSDLFLMPSKFEPCGLTNMIAMRFGTLPIVRMVGGLKDTVRDGYNGFGFKKYTADTLFFTIRRAYDVYSNYQKVKKTGKKLETKWERMVKHAMRKDFSWKKSSRQYRTLYYRAIRKRLS